MPKLNKQPTNKIDENMNTIFEAIQKVTNNNCKSKTMKQTRSYKLTNKMQQKLKQLQVKPATNNYYRYGFLTTGRLYNMEEELLTIIYEENSKNWNLLVQKATECNGNPAIFWNKIKHLIGGDYSLNNHSNKLILMTILMTPTLGKRLLTQNSKQKNSPSYGQISVKPI